MKNLFRFLCLLLGSFQLALAQTPADLKTKLPEVKGWTIDKTVETFDQNTLYERINGAAPSYILNHFEELTVFVYQKTGSKDYITMQIYRHATPVDAFGIYSSERPIKTDYLDIGAESYRESGIMNLLVGNLYVKLESPSTDAVVNETMTQIAKSFARKIDPKATLPTALQLFPDENRLAHSEQYMAQSFLGHEFLNGAYTVAYEHDGQTYQLFIIDAGTQAAAKTMIEKYFAFTKQNDKVAEGKIDIKDKYNGEIMCCWKGRYIWGVLNDNGLTLPVATLLDKINKRIEKK